MNAVKARADTASAKCDVLDPIRRLAELVEMAPMEELQAAEAKTDALRKAAQAAGDALQKAIAARRRLTKRG
jgi:hypothetical protein